MSITQLDNTARCQHVRTSGRPCKAPARRGTQWCVFHAIEHKEEPLPFSTLDDAAGVHAAVGQVLLDLQRDCIDFRRAALLFSGLRIMRANLKQLALELGDDTAAPVSARKKTTDDDELPGPSFAETLLERVNELMIESPEKDNGN